MPRTKSRPKAASDTADCPLKAEDFRLFLQSELVRRCQANPRYSLRAFSRTLGLEPSALSKLLGGKRRLTLEMFHRISQQLALGPEDIRQFLGFLPATPDDLESKGSLAQPNFDQINLDAFQVMADWYHLAIVELANTTGFRGEPYWIARSLGISVTEARVALERLLRLEMLARGQDGKIIGTTKTITTVGTAYTAAALRKMQRQVLEKAIEALADIPADRRDQSNMTMAVNKERLESAKDMIRDFRRKLCAHLEGEGPLTEVYHLSISLYPVTTVGY